MKKILLTVVLIILCIHAPAKLVDAWPLVIRANTATSFTFVIKDEPLLVEPDKLILQFVPMDKLKADGKQYGGTQYETIPYKLDNGVLTTGPVQIRQEGEYVIRLVGPAPKDKPKEPKVAWTQHIYSLEPDLFKLHAYRGSFHVSAQVLGEQGKLPKSKAHYFASLRQRSFDFAFYVDTDLDMARQDIAAFTLPTDLKLYPGEEILLPNKSAALLALNAQGSVLKAFKNEQETDPIAITNALVDAGRALGGFMVFDHVFNRVEGCMTLPLPMMEKLLEGRHYDALETVGSPEANLDTAMYYELCGKGTRVPCVGGMGRCTPAELGLGITVVLAESCSASDLFKAVREGRAAAVYQPPFTYKRIHGDFRHSRYIAFLLRYVFTRDHDNYCRKEAAAMMAVLDAPKDDAKAQAQAKESLAFLQERQGKSDLYYDKYWR